MMNSILRWEMSYIKKYSNVFLVGSPTVHIAYYVSR